MRFNTTITVKGNGKLDVSMLYAMMDMSEYGYEEEAFTESERQDLIDEGWEVEDYNQDGFVGLLISRKNVTANELNESMQDSQSDFSGELGNLSYTRHGLKYVLDWQVFDSAEYEELRQFKNYFSMSGGYMKMTVVLPVKPTASNATSVSSDGKTLEWDLLNLGPDQSIHLEFMLINIWLIIGLCALAFLIVIGIILAIVLTSKKRKAEQMQTAGYYQPVNDYRQQGQYNSVPGFQQNPAPQQPTYQAYQQPQPTDLVADELTKLKKLLDDGVITQEEFEAQKNKLLNK